VLDLLDDAERPLIIAGNGPLRTGATDELRAFVESTGIPVASTYMGKGAVSDRSPQSLLTLDSGSHHEASDAIEQADLVLTVGYDIAEHDPAGWNKGTGTVLVHMDSEPAEVYEAYNPNLELVCDLAAALSELTAGVADRGTRFDERWYGELREHILTDVTTEPSPEDPFTVEAVLPVLREVMADEDVLLSDVGSHKLAIAQNFPTYEPNTCIISNGLASMGISVPGGLAADLAVDGNVVAATGDGGFLMNGAEIETATRVGCGYTILLFVDDDYGLISEKHEAHRGESFGTGLTNPDFTTLAGSFGIDGYRPEDWDELEAVLQEAVGSDRMALVEVPVE